MKRLIALILIGLFSTGVLTAPTVWAQAPKASSSMKHELLDLNTASEADLKTIPGIGDAYAKKIVAGRPYKAKDELWEKKIIPKATYQKIRDQVIAHQSR